MKEIISKDLIVKDIPLKDVSDNPYQPRKRYGRRELKILAKNIYERGLFHPVSVVKLRDKYVLVAGHRRARAFKILRRKTIPAIIRKRSTQKDLALDLAIENALRKDFYPIEKANSILQVLSTIKNVNGDVLKAYCLVSQVKLMNKRGIEKVKNTKGESIGFTDDDLFKCLRLLNLLGISENTATSYLRLLDLPKELQDKILVYASNEKTAGEHLDKGIISVKMGYELSRVKSNKLRVTLYHQIIKDRLRYVQIKHIIDEILENNSELQINKLGTSKRRGKEDYGVAHLTKRSFNLSSSLWNFRRYMPILQFNLDKIIFRASLVKLKKACLRLVNDVNDVLNEELNIKETIELTNAEKTKLELFFSEDKGNYRFTFPMRIANKLGIEDKDKIEIEIKKIIKGGKK